MIKLALLTQVVFVCLTACSEESNNREKQDHIWNEQTDTLNKAKAVEGLIQDAAEARGQQIMDGTE
jgi:outer membrane biogenesis lipoprotein LolB